MGPFNFKIVNTKKGPAIPHSASCSSGSCLFLLPFLKDFARYSDHNFHCYFKLQKHSETLGTLRQLINTYLSQRHSNALPCCKLLLTITRLLHKSKPGLVRSTNFFCGGMMPSAPGHQNCIPKSNPLNFEMRFVHY